MRRMYSKNELEEIVKGATKDNLKKYVSENDIASFDGNDIENVVKNNEKIVEFATDEHITGIVLSAYQGATDVYYVDILADSGAGLKIEKYEYDGEDVTHTSEAIGGSGGTQLYIHKVKINASVTMEGITQDMPIIVIIYSNGSTPLSGASYNLTNYISGVTEHKILGNPLLGMENDGNILNYGVFVEWSSDNLYGYFQNKLIDFDIYQKSIISDSVTEF